MAGAAARRSGWLRWVAVPLGRLLHLLGFRLRFWWTLPVPYHPLIALLLPFVPLALVGWATVELVQGGPPSLSWWALFLSGLLLAVPLSIPIFNIFAFAFRVPLLQGFCFLGAMLLLAAEVASGGRPLVHGLLPAGYFLLFLVQRVGGPIRLRRLQRDSEAFVPFEASDKLVRLILPGRGDQPLWQARNLMRDRGLAQVAVRSTGWPRRGRLLLRPDGQTRQLLRDMVPERALVASSEGIRIEGIDADRLKPAIDVRLQVGRDWLLDGRFSLLTVRSGGERRRLASGMAAPVGNWPLLILFYDFAVFSGGTRQGRWQAGFVPQKAVAIGSEGEHQLLARVFADGPGAEVSADALRSTLAPLERHLARQRAAEEKAREKRLLRAAADVDRFLESGNVSLQLFGADFSLRPELLRGKGKALCEALAAAKERRDRTAARTAAVLLGALPLDEFVALEEKLLPLLASRILALDWQLTPELDRSGLPEGCPRWGPIAGFGLMKLAPELWARMGELGPRFARFTELFIREVGERPMLLAARARFAERGLGPAAS